MAIISISSRISRGYIGNTASAFAARRLGIDVWEVPTVMWAHHPGHGRPAGIVTPATDLADMLASLERPQWRKSIDLVMTGYFRTAEQVSATGDFIKRLQDSRQQFMVLVDPVCGDAGGAYVPEDIVNAIRTHLLPLADIITPNRFELDILTGETSSDNTSLIHAARSLASEMIVVTTAFPATLGIGNLLVERRTATLHETLAFPDPPHGTGDLFAGVFAARILKSSAKEALLHAGNTVFRVVEATNLSGNDELDLAQWNDLIDHPPHTGNITTVRSTNA
ncbi:MAG: pyridoxal kinase [Anderseniella sp.]